MNLSATLTLGDIKRVLERLTPVRIALRSRRELSIGRPSRVELVPSEGLRLGGDARFTWDAYGITLPVTVRAWQILLRPRVGTSERRQILRFDAELEHVELEGVPALFEGRIKGALGLALETQVKKLVWGFEHALTAVLPLPPAVSPPGICRLSPSSGRVDITADTLTLALEFSFRVDEPVIPQTNTPQRALLSR